MVRKVALAAAVVASLTLSPPAEGTSVVQISASPNPVSIGQRAVHTVGVGLPGRLDIWVSSKGFGQPGMGTLPPGSWTLTCCPRQTAGTSAWHYRSSSTVAAGTYRFGADTRRTGTYLSTAAVSGASASVWVRIV